MSNITTLKVVSKLNQTESEGIVVCTEWSDLKIKVLVIRNDKDPYVGEALLQDFVEYAKTFNKTLEKYLEEMQTTLSGKHDDDIEFFFKDDTFYWKRKQKKLLLGKISVQPVTEFQSLTGFTLFLIDNYSKFQKNTYELQKENQNFKSMYAKLSNELNEIRILKEQMEVTLYKRFRLLLNTKKAKIRELKNKLEKFESKEDTVFDAVTDESEVESDYEDDVAKSENKKGSKEKDSKQVQAKNKSSAVTPEKIIKNMVAEKKKIYKSNENNENIIKSVNKRLLEDDFNNEIKEKRKKLITTLQPDVDKQAVSEPIASTSTDTRLTCTIGEDDETPDFHSEESECDLELKYEEERDENESKSDTNIKEEEDSEEDMFSS